MVRSDVFRTQTHGIGRAIVSAFCTGLIGVGLARFAYTPLLPAVVEARWFAPAAAAYLGAANLAGYLAGACLGRPLSAKVTAVAILRAMMLAATASFFACGFPLGFLWFFLWRFTAGFAGGAMMVLAAPAVLAHVPANRRGIAGGLIVMGVGTGIAASGTLIPLLLHFGVQQAWIGLGILSAALTALAWNGWPENPVPEAPEADHVRPPQSRVLRALYVEYGLNAGGWVPHMLFFVDYVERGLGKGIVLGAEFWVAFGLSATLGPILAGHVADRIGFRPALRCAFLMQIFAIAIPALNVTSAPWLFASSIVVGGFVTGTVTLVLGRIHELLPDRPAEQKSAWSVATIIFALCQAIAAYGLSLVFAHSGGDYQILFLLGAAAMTLSLLTDLAASERTR